MIVRDREAFIPLLVPIIDGQQILHKVRLGIIAEVCIGRRASTEKSNNAYEKEKNISKLKHRKCILPECKKGEEITSIQKRKRIRLEFLKSKD
jgi:hypothetical protein